MCVSLLTMLFCMHVTTTQHSGWLPYWLAYAWVENRGKQIFNWQEHQAFTCLHSNRQLHFTNMILFYFSTILLYRWFLLLPLLKSAVVRIVRLTTKFVGGTTAIGGNAPTSVFASTAAIVLLCGSIQFRKLLHQIVELLSFVFGLNTEFLFGQLLFIGIPVKSFGIGKLRPECIKLSFLVLL